jgi:hypothetical protein
MTYEKGTVMSRQFSGPRNLPAFGRLKRKYSGWSRWASFVALTVPVAALAGGGLAGSGGIPAGVLGTWSGQIALTKGLTESFALSLTHSGTAGSPVAVGTFTNHTVGCGGNVFLVGVSGGKLVELSLATTVDPIHACPASMEADVRLAKGGSALAYEIIGVDSVRATLQNPLAKGALYR